MESKRVCPRRRLLNLAILKATIETRSVAFTSLRVPVLDVRIVHILYNHGPTIKRVNAGLGAGEAACLVHGPLTRAVGLRVASQVNVGAALFLGEAVAGLGDWVGTHVMLVFDHSL